MNAVTNLRKLLLKTYNVVFVPVWSNPNECCNSEKKRFKLRRAAIFMHMQQVNSFHVVRDHICFMFSVTKVCGFRSVVCKLLTRFACCLFGSVPKGFYLFVHCPYHRFSLCIFYCWTDAIIILEWFIAWGLFLSFYFLGFF